MGVLKGHTKAATKTKENLIEAYRLWAEECWTVEAIARHFHVQDKTMLGWLKEADALWNSELLAGRQLLLSRSITQCHVVSRKAHEGFEKSRKKAGQSGNPSFLAVVLSAQSQLIKMLGDAAAPTTLGEQLADVPYEHSQALQQTIANLEGRKRNDQNASTGSPPAPDLSENGNGERFPPIDFGDDEPTDEPAGGNELDDL